MSENHDKPAIRANRSNPMPMAVLLFVAAAFAGASAAGPLDQATAADGLKEALGVGTIRSVDFLGQLDGYLKNKPVKIRMPEELDFAEKALETIGREDLTKEFIISMNRAAESAAPIAKDVFLETIKEMSFDDALKIVKGKKHEATDYLQVNAGPKLAKLFRPIVSEELDGVGATRTFDDIMERTAALPFVKAKAFDLEEYVTSKALDGMFLTIAQEEEKIRKNPAARTTELLEKVFGKGESEDEDLPWWKRIFK